jgi:hypothetical protein
MSHARLLVAPALSALCAACAVAEPEPIPPPFLPPRPAFGAPPPVRGLALGLYGERSGGSYRAMLEEIRAMGATHVSLVVHGYQRDVRATQIAPGPEGPSDDGLADLIADAHRLGLKVFLFPIIQLMRRGPGEWRGTLKPSEWGRWFASYERFLLRHARLAARHGVDLLAVGSELLSTEDRRGDWSRLLRRVRGVYRGNLTYSANWDHYRQVRFWDLLDAVGVNGYFEVGRHGDAVAPMRAEWMRIRERLEAFARRAGKPLLITEVGYPSVQGGARWPWHYTRRAPVDAGEQERAYRAFVEAWQGAPRLAGVFFWNWWGAGGPNDADYTPRGKPAEKVLRAWYRADAVP